jgi:succinoglycan biosynthesis transport protein ExoP
MEERSLHLLDYVSVLRRRRWWLIVPVVLAILGGTALALMLPRQYSSTATIAVTSSSVSSDLVKTNPEDLAERVRAIQHELLSRPVLERVARDEGLADSSSMDAAIARVRSGTTVSPAKTIATGGRTGPDTFLVTYVGRAPELTQRITNAVTSAFIDQHSRIRETRAEETSAFLSAQLGQTQTRLKAVEERLRKMKEAYMGRLPEQTQANLQMLGGLRTHQDNTAMSLRSEQDRLAILERSIEAMKRGGASDAPLSRVSGASAQERLLTLRRELDEASAMYTEKHPEIQRLKGEIASAEALAKQEAARPAAEREPALNADPTYRQLLADAQASRLKIRELERASSRAGNEIAQYQTRVEAAPMVEQQLSSLTREYELEKQQYNALAERHQSALIAEDLERRRAGEQFAVLYPASRALQTAPNVPRLLLFAIGLGIVGGAVLAVGREYLDRSVYDARTLQAEFELPVLAEIPRITAP